MNAPFTASSHTPARSEGPFRTNTPKARTDLPGFGKLATRNGKGIRLTRLCEPAALALLLFSTTLALPSQAQSGPCRVTSITPANGKVIIHWTNGAPPYQVQMQTNMMALWENVGPQTTLCCATNLVRGGMGFFRVICGSNPPPPTIIIAAAQPNASMTGPTNGVFTVARAGAIDAAITVPYTITGTASNGVDYAALPGSVTLDAGVASANIIVAPTAVTLSKPSQTVTLAIRPPAGFLLGASSNATVRITNTNTSPPLPPMVMIIATRPNASKAGPINGNFVVARSASIDTAITVPYTISGTASNGVDYATLPGSVTLEAGVRFANVVIAPIPDTLVRPTLKATLTLSAPAGFQLDSRSSASVFIMNTNVPPPPSPILNIAASQPNASKAGPTNGSFTVSRTGSTASALSVPYTITGTAANGVDYLALPGSVILGVGVATANIVVTPIPDSLVRPTLTVTLAISAPAGTVLGASSSATVSIANTNVPPPPPPTVSIVASQPNASKAGPINGVFTVSRAGSAAEALTVPYTISGTAANGVDYVALPGSVTLGAGAVSADILVTPIPDAVVRPALTVTLSISAPVGALLGAPNSATVSIANTNQPPPPPTLNVVASQPNASKAGPINGMFTVSRTGSSAAALTVPYTISGTAANGVDYIALPGSVTLGAGAASANIVVSPIPDTLVQPTLTVSLTLSAPAGTLLGAPSSATVSIANTNVPVVAPSLGGPARLVGFLPAIGLSHDVAVNGSVAYVATDKWGLSLVDISNPDSPKLLGASPLSFDGSLVAVSGSVAAVVGSRTFYDTNSSPPVVQTVSGLYFLNVAVSSNVRVLSVLENNVIYDDVAISGHYAVVACWDGLRIFDIADPSNPILISTFTTLSSAWGVTVSGNYAYVACRLAGVQIVNISNPYLPVAAGSVVTSGAARSVAVEDTLACVGTGNSLDLIDVSNPSVPVRLGSVATTAGKVKLKNHIAYVAAGGQGLVLVDVRNPALPIQFGALRPNVGQYAHTEGVAVSGSVAYVANYDGGLGIINVAVPASGPATLSHLGHFSEWFAGSYMDTKPGLAVATGARYSGGGGTAISALRVINTSDPARPRVVGNLETASLGFLGVAVSGNFAYVASGAAGLQVVDISNPASPIIVGAFDTPGWANSVTVVGNLAYVADGGLGLRIVDVSNPRAPISIGWVDTPGTAKSVTVVGTLAYVADNRYLQIIDVSTPTAPTIRGSIAVDALDVKVLDGIAYVVTGSALVIVDVHNSSTPTLLGNMAATFGSLQGLGVIGTTAYLGNFSSGVPCLQAVDISNPANPTVRYVVKTMGNPKSVIIDGNWLCLSDDLAGINTINRAP